MPDEYNGLAEKTVLTREEALALKEEIRRRQDAGELAADVTSSSGGGAWLNVIMQNPQEAVDYLNTPPIQGPGEASLTNRPDGQVDVYILLR